MSGIQIHNCVSTVLDILVVSADQEVQDEINALQDRERNDLENHWYRALPHKFAAGRLWAKNWRSVLDGIEDFLPPDEVLSAKLSILVALRLLGGENRPPPPDALVDSLVEIVEDAAVSRSVNGVQPQESVLVGPEIIVGVLQGWRPDNRDQEKQLNELLAGWPFDPGPSREVLENVMYESGFRAVHAVMEVLMHLFTPRKDLEWTRNVLDRFLSGQGTCLAEVLCDEPEAGGDPETKLAGNTLKRYITCSTKHRLDAWIPNSITLWNFLQQAVKGSWGSIKMGGLPTGMLFSRMNRDCAVVQLLVAHYVCGNCSTSQWYEPHHCPSCCQEFNAETIVVAKKICALDPKRCPDFRPGRCWRCPGTYDEPCGHHYPTHQCPEACADDADCDHCPRPSCEVRHERGPGRRPKTVCFYMPGDGPAPQIVLENDQDPEGPSRKAGGSLQAQESLAQWIQRRFPQHHARLMERLRRGLSLGDIADELDMEKEDLWAEIVHIMSDLTEKQEADEDSNGADSGQNQKDPTFDA